MPFMDMHIKVKDVKISKNHKKHRPCTNYQGLTWPYKINYFYYDNLFNLYLLCKIYQCPQDIVHCIYQMF